MIRKEIIISGLKISYLISPDFNLNQAIVFLPGWKSPVDLFCKTMGDLPNLVAINLPGWGGSDKPKEVWGLKEYAKFVQEFSKKLNINNPIIIGHSIGGAIAVEYLNGDNRAKKLIIIGGAIIREKSAKLKLLFLGAKTFRLLFPFINKKVRQRLIGKNLSPDYLQAGEMEEIYKRLINEDRQIAFSKLNLPVTLIWGKDDKDTPLSYADRLAESNQLASLEVINDAGHYCFLDKPEEFRKILFKYL